MWGVSLQAEWRELQPPRGSGYKQRFVQPAQYGAGKPEPETMRIVVNLSSQDVTPATVSFLAKGLNFAPSP